MAQEVRPKKGSLEKGGLFLFLGDSFHAVGYPEATGPQFKGRTLPRVPDERKRVRVLIVDDEEMIADTLARILNASGFEARAAFSGEGAISLASEFQPDILLTDVIMCGLSGIEVAIAVSKALLNCRVILFSGQAMTADLQHRADVQGHYFELIAKPIHPQELLKVLRDPKP